MSTFLLLALENHGWASMSRGMGRAAGSFVTLRPKNVEHLGAPNNRRQRDLRQRDKVFHGIAPWHIEIGLVLQLWWLQQRNID